MGRRRQPKGSTRLAAPEGEPGLYPEGTPLESSGLAQSNVRMSAEKARRIGHDADAARRNKVSSEVLAAKGAGQSGIDFNTSDQSQKFRQVKEFEGDADIRIQQIHPHRDHNVPPVYVGALGSFEDLVEHVKQSHWRNENATYEWVAVKSGRTICVGRIYLREDPNFVRGDEVAARKQEPSQQPWGPPGPQGGWTPPAAQGPVGAPPGWAWSPQYGWVQLQTQAQQPNVPMQYSPPPTPQAQPGDTAEMMELRYKFALKEHELSLLKAQMQAPPPAPVVQQQPVFDPKTNPGWYWHPVEGWKNALAAPVTPATAPPTQIDPIQETSRAFDVAKRVNKMMKDLTEQVGPPAPAAPPAQPEPNPHSPVQVQQVGPARIMTIDGEPQTSPLGLAISNWDLVRDGVDNMFKKGKDTVDDVLKKKKELVELEMQRTKEAEEASERAREAQRKAEQETVAAVERIARAKQVVAEAAEREALANALLGNRKPAAPPPNGEPKPESKVEEIETIPQVPKS